MPEEVGVEEVIAGLEEERSSDPLPLELGTREALALALLADAPLRSFKNFFVKSNPVLRLLPPAVEIGFGLMFGFGLVFGLMF